MRRVFLFVVLCACANARAVEEGKGDAPTADPNADRPVIDGPVPAYDARPVDATTPPDAAAQDPIACDEHTDCASAKCCLLGLCVTGDVVFDGCVPN